MAESQEDRSPDDLTEDASPFRIEELRRKGQVAQSRELSGMIGLLAAAAALYGFAPSFGADLSEFMREVFSSGFSPRTELGEGSLMKTLILRASKLTGFALIPVFASALVVGMIASFAQVGSVFSTDPITPNLEKIDPLKGIQRFFSMKMATEALRLILKTAVLVFVAYGTLKTVASVAPSMAFMDPAASGAWATESARKLFLSLFLVLLCFAGFDLFMQRREFQKNVRMTKQEAKQEFKEREGDPALKARIRMIQRDMARKRMMAAVKSADVIVTNPTHIAIALKYDRDKMAAPRVVAKGADFIAQRIKQIAAEAGIPTVENIPLARTLYKTVKLNHAIPRALFQAVAEVLAYVYRLKGRRE